MILDSVERLIRRNAYELSGIFNYDSGGTVYSRVEGLASPAGMFGFSYNALREAVYGEQSDRLLIVRYESMVGNPLGTLAAIYGFIGEELYPHDPRHIEPCYDMIEFDLRHARPARRRPRRRGEGAQADPAAGPPRALPEGRVLGGPQATAADRQARLSRLTPPAAAIAGLAFTT
jgi:sulfotransferase